MALFFNLEKLETEAEGNSRVFLSLLHKHFKRQPIVRGKYKQEISLAGTSFLLNPAPIFDERSIDSVFLMHYAQLAGRRDYTLYRLHDVVYLDMSFYPDVNRNSLKINPLLKLTHNQLHFKYEDDYHGT